MTNNNPKLQIIVSTIIIISLARRTVKSHNLLFMQEYNKFSFLHNYYKILCSNDFPAPEPVMERVS